MIQSQTFAILREPQALAGAERISRLMPVFEKAAAVTGIPASLVSAIAYLESWGDANAQSPAGPKGIMQFAEATARSAGLSISYATHYRTEKVRTPVKTNGKAVFRTVVHKSAYTVKVRDDRFVPERAVLAASTYLGRLRDKFGGLDWAVFAYHCGEGCVTEMRELTMGALPLSDEAPTVAQMFFTASPAEHRDLYDAIQRHMQRDYSPTYWFRVKRAEQLLHLYQTNPGEFRELRVEYRNPINPDRRANDRLAVWLKADDVLYQSCDDLKAAKENNGLVSAPNDALYYNYSIAKLRLNGVLANNRDLYVQASPAAIGTLSYIAFETRRLYEKMKPHSEKWVPLEVLELVSTKDLAHEGGESLSGLALPAHCTGQVFDLDVASLPRGEREALSFVLDEMGWDGYLGFVDATAGQMHIGCAPSARQFFSQIYDEMRSPGV